MPATPKAKRKKGMYLKAFNSGRQLRLPLILPLVLVHSKYEPPHWVLGNAIIWEPTSNEGLDVGYLYSHDAYMWKFRCIPVGRLGYEC